MAGTSWGIRLGNKYLQAEGASGEGPPSSRVIGPEQPSGICTSGMRPASSGPQSCVRDLATAGHQTVPKRPLHELLHHRFVRRCRCSTAALCAMHEVNVYTFLSRRRGLKSERTFGWRCWLCFSKFVCERCMGCVCLGPIHSPTTDSRTSGAYTAVAAQNHTQQQFLLLLCIWCLPAVLAACRKSGNSIRRILQSFE